MRNLKPTIIWAGCLLAPISASLGGCAATFWAGHRSTTLRVRPRISRTLRCGARWPAPRRDDDGVPAVVRRGGATPELAACRRNQRSTDWLGRSGVAALRCAAAAIEAAATCRTRGRSASSFAYWPPVRRTPRAWRGSQLGPAQGTGDSGTHSKSWDVETAGARPLGAAAARHQPARARHDGGDVEAPGSDLGVA